MSPKDFSLEKIEEVQSLVSRIIKARPTTSYLIHDLDNYGANQKRLDELGKNNADVIVYHSYPVTKSEIETKVSILLGESLPHKTETAPEWKTVLDENLQGGVTVKLPVDPEEAAKLL